MPLSTDFKDDILHTSVNVRPKYQMVNNPDGTVSFIDVTSYAQTGTQFGAKEIIEERNAINSLDENVRQCNNNIDKVNQDITQVKQDVDADITQVKQDVDADITQVKQDVNADITQVKQDVNNAKESINNKFFIVSGTHSGLRSGSKVSKTATVGTISETGGSSNLQIIFAGQDQETHFESASGSTGDGYKGVYQPMVYGELAGYSNDQISAYITPTITSIRNSGNNVVINFDLTTVEVELDLEVYANIRYRIVLMKIS